MKKIITLLCAVLIPVLIFSGCDKFGKKPETTETANGTEKTEK